MRFHQSDELLDQTQAATNSAKATAPPGNLLALQMLAGNAAVTRLVNSPQKTMIQREVDELDGGLPPGGAPTAAPAAAAPAAERELPYITMKRKHIHLFGDDKYGHWWTEMDGSESYGWWPKGQVGLIDTLFGTEGELNGVTNYGGSPTRDPHHGDGAEDVFHPVLKDGSKTDSTVRSEVRTFASSYSGSWRWTFGWGQNCHTFQESLMASIGLKQP
jgi:hypothetical protein